ncbi:DegT/DnrJ/EryC1/StrS family aminotransferase [Pedobacter sp. HMWF019]|uniref:DegT/DnrJ/EryC1/StrS family aminotransferase n=1 Tax=Pedobacter sp. HMWF019 TaxID=2056856 RepID=UPI000D362E43|nr:DegT/DnrJ/EryC1/StrS family aminotransferase [Pedobacter sp. HMWF019]PTS95977.1 DegT/DnrJ/EryC1/StrS family aminotransferase [Pedobacter sp. HMWF019]
MAKLAINGGEAVRTELFPAYNTIGQEEKDAVMQVLDTGNLSQFLGAEHSDFLGGPNVKRFEREWADAIGVKHAVSVNSNTSGLFTAMGAIGIQPGDEVIVSPYSMSASAIAPLIYGGVPVFADIDPVTFCMDPVSIEKCITANTKAILVVHIFGHPADMDPIMDLAKKHNLYVVEDCAQAPMAKYKGKYVGTIGDLGIFSLNYHKHIHTGEGGVITSNSDKLVERCQMIRNHAENIVGPRNTEDLTNLIGYNYRMTEIECAIGIQQLKKLPGLLEERLKNVAYLNEQLAQFPALELQPAPKDGSVHTYYVHPIKFNKEIAGIDRNTFVNALKAELPSAILRETAPLIGAGYVKPIYLQPIYQERAAWAFQHPAAAELTLKYELGTCPVTEKMHFELLFTHEFMRPGMSEQDMDDVVRAFKKIFNNINELKSVETTA